MQKNGFGYVLISVFFLGLPNLFGCPAGRLSSEIELEMRIFDSNHKLLGKYLGQGKSLVWIAPYWGYDKGSKLKLLTDAFNDAMSKIRPQIQADAEKLNTKLLEAGKMQ
jgi:hypothetical protein